MPSRSCGPGNPQLRDDARVDSKTRVAETVNKEEFYNQGMEFFAQDKLEEAIAAYERALEEDANYADALHALAMSYAQLGRLEEAIAAGKRLIEVAPDDELAYTSLSIFYQQKGMVAEAEQVGAQARTLGWKRQLDEAKQRKKS